MVKMITAERRNKIAEYIVANGSIKAGDLARMFDVTMETIRKDLIYLDQAGIVKKSHGGAQSTLEVMDRPFEDRRMVGPEFKTAIAERAMNFIKDNAVIYIDAGSTNSYLAKLLYLKQDLTIFTPSISAANALALSKNKVYMCGGLLNSTTMSLTGMGAASFLRNIKVDIAFLGSSGFKGHKGPSAIEFADAEVKQVIMENSDTSIVLAHSEKAKSTALLSFASWQDIDYLITDANLDKASEEEIGKHTEIIKVCPSEKKIV